MKRREAREHIFQILFQINFHPIEEFNEKIELYLTEHANEDIEGEIVDLDDETKEFINRYVTGVAGNVQEIDKVIDEKSKGWKTTRMPNADLTILRISVYEMLFTKDMPVNISINEAVELAKKYCNDESPGFINALLGEIVK